jgi:hypothetical protein
MHRTGIDFYLLRNKIIAGNYDSVVVFCTGK